MFRKAAIATAVLAAAQFTASGAGAATFVFKGDGGNVSPLGAEGVDYVKNCGTADLDYCTTNPVEGLNYQQDGVGLKVRAYANGVATRLIQDVWPGDSGLGAFSESNGSDDQTQADSGESIEFNFDRIISLSNIEFNAGGDINCSSFGAEGPCGDFRLTIDGAMMGIVTARDTISFLGTGMSFLLEAVTSGAGFTVAQLTTNDVAEVPAPAALPLLLAGLAGLGFASRGGRRSADHLIR